MKKISKKKFKVNNDSKDKYNDYLVVYENYVKSIRELVNCPVVAKTLTELEDIWNEYQVYENDEINYIDDSIKVHYAKLGESENE